MLNFILNESVERLKETVIDGGYCIGCGGCSVLENSPFKIEMNDDGCLEAKLNKTSTNSGNKNYLAICPFADDALDEDRIGRKLFNSCENHDNLIGYYRDLLVGHVTNGNNRNNSSSGGLTKWLLSKLLEERKVDKVICVVSASKEKEGSLFKYSVVETPSQLYASAATSAYYPVEMSEVLEYVKNNDFKYAIVGVPCFVKSIQLLKKDHKVFNERILFTVGLVCGHLKSKYYSEMIGWQLGVEPDELSEINFRKKQSGRKANEKGVEIKSTNNKTEVIEGNVKDLFGTNYGHGYFKYKACDFCDDVFAETADVTFGDAWLPRFIDDERGNNIVVIRNEQISNLVMKGIEKGELSLDILSKDDLIQSQESGINHKKEGLVIRIDEESKLSRWVPRKRVNKLGNKTLESKKEIYKIRTEIREKSFWAFKNAKRDQDFQQFKNHMEDVLQKYSQAYSQFFKETYFNKLQLPDHSFKCYIFGSGELGLYVHHKLDVKGIQVLGFIDSDSRKIGQYYNGLKTFSPYAIEEEIRSDEKIIIASSYYKEIIKFIYELNLQKYLVEINDE